MRYNIYAGLSGGFGDATYQFTADYESEEDAISEAYNIAVDDYEAYSGSHGLKDWEDVEAELEEDGELEGLTESQREDYIAQVLNEETEEWISYYVKPTEEDSIKEEDLVGFDYMD